jgi:hypothetical protein
MLSLASALALLAGSGHAQTPKTVSSAAPTAAFDWFE